MTAQQAAELFRSTYASEPDGVWESPGRVNLIGEHTDYNDGLVLPIALPERTWCAARRVDDDTLAFVSAALDEKPRVGYADIAPGTPKGWGKYPAGVAFALREAGHDVPGAQAAFVSTVPVGSGLSSSAAIEGATAAALTGLAGIDLLSDDAGRAELARLCQRAENYIAQAPTGGMDQAVSLRATSGHALLLDCRDGSIEQVPFDLAEHDLALLVIDTRASHSHADGEYGDRRRACEQAASELGVGSLRDVSVDDLEASLARLSDDVLRRRVRHVVTEIQRVREAVAALRAGDFAELGRLFDASHVSMRDDFEISCAELDTAVDTAQANGALGARMTGGGFGGSAIALVRAGDVEAVTGAVEQAFAEAGFNAPLCFAATAAGPATRSE